MNFMFGNGNHVGGYRNRMNPLLKPRVLIIFYRITMDFVIISSSNNIFCEDKILKFAL